jgi:hypothetical protein
MEERFDRRRELSRLRHERAGTWEVFQQRLEVERANERSRRRRREWTRLIALVVVVAAATSLAVALSVTLTGGRSSAASLRSSLPRCLAVATTLPVAIRPPRQPGSSA